MSDFVPINYHLREVLIFFFHSKKTAAEAHRELQKVYGDAAVSETTCRDWFCRLRGSPHQSASKNRFFLLLQSLELLSENILAKFQSIAD